MEPKIHRNWLGISYLRIDSACEDSENPLVPGPFVLFRFGRLIRAWREDLQLNQKDVARAAGLNLSTYTAIEDGENAQLHRVAAVLRELHRRAREQNHAPVLEAMSEPIITLLVQDAKRLLNPEGQYWYHASKGKRVHAKPPTQRRRRPQLPAANQGGKR